MSRVADGLVLVGLGWGFLGCKGEPAGSGSAPTLATGPPTSAAADGGETARKAVRVRLPFRQLPFGLRPMKGSCPSGKGEKTRDMVAALETTASKGNACSAAEVVDILLRLHGPPDDFAKALTYAAAAQDVGVRLEYWMCELFDLADDSARLATCYERNDPSRFRAMLTIGEGTRAEKGQSFSDRYCNSNLGTSSLEMRNCSEDRMVAADYQASMTRLAASDRLTPDEVGRSRVALDRYVESELLRGDLSFSGGSGFTQSMCSTGLAASLQATYDDALQRLAGLSPLLSSPAPDDEAVDRAWERTEAASASADSVAAIDAAPPKGRGANYLEALADSKVKYLAYEQRMAEIAKARFGEPGERAMRTLLRGMRRAALGRCPGNGEDPP